MNPNNGKNSRAVKLNSATVSAVLLSGLFVFTSACGSVRQSTTTILATPVATATISDTSLPATTTTRAPMDTGTGKSFTIYFPQPAGTSPPYMLFYNDVKYTGQNLWVRQESADTVRIGFTDYGQAAMGNIWYLDLPAPGTVMNRGFTFGYVQGEDTQNVNFTAPVSGTVLEVNQELLADFHLVNRSPYDAGWMILVRISNPDDLNLLMTAAEYASTSCPPCHCSN